MLLCFVCRVELEGSGRLGSVEVLRFPVIEESDVLDRHRHLPRPFGPERFKERHRASLEAEIANGSTKLAERQLPRVVRVQDLESVPRAPELLVRPVLELEQIRVRGFVDLSQGNEPMFFLTLL